ncbi:MAG: class I SAM-dependent methyltransferase [bacterium]|nr:class I SAM-dependent methyltransferase [bacterium]
MSIRTVPMTDRLHEYLLRNTLREPPLGQRLREETAMRPDANLQIAPEQGQLMMLLVELIGARRAIEVGVFTGYSGLCIATALPDDGRLVACDVNDTWTRIARRYWRESGLDDKIDFRLGPGTQSLQALLEAGEAGGYDFIFIDADKPAYDAYYELALRLLRPGGLVTFDNMLQHGRVADEEAGDESTRAIRALNRKIQLDERVSMCLVPVGDGLMVVRKR